MADSYSIFAKFGVQDNGFLSFLNKANSGTSTLGGMFKGGALFGAGMKAFNMLTGGIGNFYTGLQDTTAAWKSFESNMAAFGKSASEIKSAKKELQSFAASSIYSSAQMSSTYSQLTAVGIEGTTELVKGFGAISGAADNPIQAMKSVSTQATQMAAKPTVAWQDFKIMLEQTPAGIAAVAKQMGMSTTELVTAVQDGSVKTEDFFNAIRELGNGANKELMKQATSYKTIGQAIEGVTATITTKLEPAWSWFTEVAIGGLWKVINFLATLGNQAQESFKKFKVSSALNEMLAALDKAFSKEFNWKDITEKTANAMDRLAQAVVKVANWISDHADEIAKLTKKAIKLIPKLIKMAVAFALLKRAVAIGSALKGLYTSFKGLSKVGTKAGEAVAQGTSKMGKAATTSGPQLLAIGGYMLMMAGAVVLLAAGFMLLANVAIKLAAAGGPAIAVFFGMVAAIVILMVVMTAIISVLSAIPVPILLAAGAAFIMMSVGVLLLAAAMYVVAAAAVLASEALVNVSGVLPILSEYGLAAAVAVIALGAGLIVFAVGAMLAGVMLLILAAGLTIAAGGMALLWGATKGVASNIKSIAKNAKTAANSLRQMVGAVDVVTAGLDAIGARAKTAMNSLKSAFNTGAAQATAAGRRVGQNFTNGLRSGMSAAASAARSAVSGVGSAMMAGASSTYSAGAYAGQGFANGLASQRSNIMSTAQSIANAVSAVIKKALKIGSPSKVTTQYGVWVGEGFANGINSQVANAQKAAAALFNPMSMGQMRMAGEMSLSDDYNYNVSSVFEIRVPVDLDGNQIAEVITGIQNTNQQRSARKAGRRI